MKAETYYGDKPCKGCVYWQAFGWNKNSLHACMYAVTEHHTRGCEPGEKCTLRKDKRRKHTTEEETAGDSQRMA